MIATRASPERSASLPLSSLSSNLPRAALEQTEHPSPD